jgi:hypothetical protein
MNRIERSRHYQEDDRYWKRAHRDWRLWIALFLMYAAMIFCLMSEDLRWRPQLRGTQASVSESLGPAVTRCAKAP